MSEDIFPHARELKDLFANQAKNQHTFKMTIMQALFNALLAGQNSASVSTANQSGQDVIYVASVLRRLQYNVNFGAGTMTISFA